MDDGCLNACKKPHPRKHPEGNTPEFIYMEHNNGGLEDSFLFQLGDL